MKNFNYIVSVVLVFVLLFCFAGLSAQADDTSTAPAERPAVTDSEAAYAVKAYDLADAKAQAEYERAMTIARRIAVARLQARMEVLTRNGKLDAALSIRNFINFLNPKTSETIAKPFIPIDKAVGLWGENGGSGGKFVLYPTGRFTYLGSQPGVWHLTTTALILKWTTTGHQSNVGRVDTYDKLDGDSVLGVNSLRGTEVKITKVK